MSGIEVVGLMLASGDALLKTYFAFHQQVEARKELPSLLLESEKRVERMCACVKRYSLGVSKEAIPGHVLEKAANEFDEIKKELETLVEQHRASNRLRRNVHFHEHVDRVRNINEKLRALEHQLDVCGLIAHENKSIRQQLENLTQAVREIAVAQNDSTITKAVETVDTTLNSSELKSEDFDIVPSQAKYLLNALAKSGLPAGEKLRLSNMARNVWEGWKVNINDIEFVRKRNGNRERIGKGGAADVFLAHIKLRDENDVVISGDAMEVAVKEFVVKSAEADAEFTQFIREIFLQKEAQHPCIVRTLGGYWPSIEEDGDMYEEEEDDDYDGDDDGDDDDDEQEEEEITPFIVMERMSCNLRQVLDKKSLMSLSSKRRVLADIASGIEHLHSRRIVHRDIKPENVLMRVGDDGQIIGRAKVSDFSVSRKAKDTIMMTTSVRTSGGIAGTYPYMPPEAFSDSAQKACMTARDIWSFGVLMCEVLAPDFIKNLVRGRSDSLHLMAMTGELARMIAKNAKHIACDRFLGGITISCLRLDGRMRPRMADISHQLMTDVPLYQFHFVDYYSREYRVNEVLRYTRQCFSIDSQTSDVLGAVAILEKAARENSDVSAQNVLGYCYHFGIGVEKDERKSRSFLQRACGAGDPTAMFYLGSVLLSAGTTVHAIHLIKSSADLGCPGAMALLAGCYRTGYGVDQDEKKAFLLLTSAGEAGDQYAQALTAWYIRCGIGTSRNEKKAIAMLYGLSASGNAFASMNLALWYKEGLGIPKDEKKSKKFVMLAQKRGVVGIWVYKSKQRVWSIFCHGSPYKLHYWDDVTSVLDV